MIEEKKEKVPNREKRELDGWFFCLSAFVCMCGDVALIVLHLPCKETKDVLRPWKTLSS